MKTFGKIYIFREQKHLKKIFSGKDKDGHMFLNILGKNRTRKTNIKIFKAFVFFK